MILGIDANNLRRGGGVTHIVEFLRAARPEKYGFSKVVIWGCDSTLKMIDDQPWLEKINPVVLERSLLVRFLWQIFIFPRAIRQKKCDILFVPGGTYMGRFKPVVTMCQNMLPFEWKELKRYGFSKLTLKFLFLRFFQSQTFKNSEGVIFLTKYAQENVLQVTGRVKGLCECIPHGVDSRFQIPPRVQKTMAEFSFENPCKIIYVSIVDQYKHQWNVVRAVHILRSFGYPIVIDFIGPSYPPALHLFNEVVDSLDPAREWVSYHGHVDYNKLHMYYENADIGCFASSCENMPNILLEKMAAGLPVACSEKGPMPEILRDMGIYFSPDDPYSIVRAFKTLLDSCDLRNELSDRSFLRSHEFSWDRCAQETFDFLARCSRQYKK